MDEGHGWTSCYIFAVDVSLIRRTVIVAMFSDDALFEQLVLKGGNALNLVYKFGSRASIDVDFSLDGGGRRLLLRCCDLNATRFNAI